MYVAMVLVLTESSFKVNELVMDVPSGRPTVFGYVIQYTGSLCRTI